MTDYKTLAEQCISADSHAITSWFESGEERITCEALKQRQIEAVAAVLKEALTPEWKDVPDELPEGAVEGVYKLRYEYRGSMCGRCDSFNANDVKFRREDPAEYGDIQYMLLAAFDANGNLVVNGGVI